MRAFGLVAVRVTTASAAGGTEIPGIRPEVADALVEELARRAEFEEGT
jgi:membrane protein YdbS with pleckstrin-like domain